VEENQGDVMGMDTVNITDIIDNNSNAKDKNLVHIAVRAIANGVANVNYEIYHLDKQGSPEPVSQDNEVRKILENPSNVYNQKQFIYK
jgi:phage portal protein BeeE